MDEILGTKAKNYKKLNIFGTDFSSALRPFRRLRLLFEHMTKCLLCNARVIGVFSRAPPAITDCLIFLVRFLSFVV